MQVRCRIPGKNRKASILVTTIIVFAFFSVIGLSLIALLYSHLTSVQLEVDRLKALYLAEAGLSQSLYEMRVGTDEDKDGIGSIKPRKLKDGIFWANHDFQASTITATGEINKIKRAIQIKYNAI